MDLIVAGNRYLSIVGNEIDKIGQQGRPNTMPDAYHYNRVERDHSEGYHITFAHTRELEGYLSSKGIQKKKQRGHLQAIVTELVASFGDPSTMWERPLDLGLGRLEQHKEVPPPPQPTQSEKKKHKGHKKKRGKDTVHTFINDDAKQNDNDTIKDMEQNDDNNTTKDMEQNDDNNTTKDMEQNDNDTTNDTEKNVNTSILHTSYFRVIHWPFGQKLRAHLGLPPSSFHITIGFNPKDIHAPKGPDSILLATSLEQDPELLTRWVASAVDYPEQTLFLQQLNQHLIKVDLGYLAEPWQHHIKQGNHCSNTI